MYQVRLLLALFFIGVTLHAEIEDKWKINLGTMFVTNFETDMQLAPKGIPLGVRVHTEDQLGMESETNAFRLDGYYRFTDTHSIDYSYFRARSYGYKSIEEDITWDDKEISAGAVVESYFDMDVYKISYGYSFYHNEKIELALTAGLHITSMNLGLDADGTIDNVVNEKYSSSESITVPLPVFGFKGEYTVIDEKLFVNYKAEYFYLKFGDYTGSFISSAINVEYRFVENVGLGFGYNSNVIFVAMDDEDKRLEVENELSGLMVYLTYNY